MHLYKVSMWQGGSGLWYTNDVEELSTVASKWYTPARLMNISLIDFVKMLKEEFHATIGSYQKDTDYLHFYFEKFIDADRYVKFINKKSRAEGWFV